MFVPSNLTLTPEQRKDLAGLYGIERAQKLLGKVSRYRDECGKKTDRSARSDYAMAIGWALQQLEEDEAQVAIRVSRKAGEHVPTAKPEAPHGSPPKPVRIGRQIE